VSLERLAEVLRTTTGLDMAALGTVALAQATAARRPQAGEADLAAYAEEVRMDPRVRRDLLAELLVHETSFFRYPGAFALLADLARAHPCVRSADPGRVFRVLSAPCSTGPEPASVVMALLEAGLPLERVRVDAVDLSAAAVSRARAGLYAEVEMRGLDPARRARFADREGGAWRLRPEVLAAVHYEAADLLDPAFALSREPYDAVLCRNLLIYLTPEARVRLLGGMRALLAPGGVLFVGHAEVLPTREAGFGVCGAPEAYAVCVRGAASVPGAGRQPAARPQPAGPAAARRAASAAPRTARGSRPAPVRPGSRPADPVETPLAEARRLADLGRAEEGLALLAREETAGRATAEAFHLAALLARALAQPEEAARALTRALYLAPRHVPSLRLAALLAREQGDDEKAARLQARAEREAATQVDAGQHDA
jgi:chemotaxis protein methyltransferase WspC